MANALFSIKPQFVQKIFSSEKQYEFRKKACRNSISKIYVYMTSPACHIVGEVVVTGLLADTPTKLWETVSEYAGISRQEFDNYFSKCGIAYAYQLESPILYPMPIDLSSIGFIHPPQSFCYLNENQCKALKEAAFKVRSR